MAEKHSRIKAWCGAVKPSAARRAALLIPFRRQTTEGATLASRSELSAFLEGVEKRAFKQAMFAVRDEEAALDIVQDAMLRLAEKYGHLPAEELPPLFHRIVQNAIRDWFRRAEGALAVDHAALLAQPRGARTTTRIRWKPWRRPTGPTARTARRSNWSRLKCLK